MSMYESQSLPLERILESVGNKLDYFPIRENHYSKYLEITQQLRKDVYPKINAGLAAMSAQSGLYTDHGPEHFDLVVQYAGLLLGVKNDADITNIVDKINSNNWILNPYELYLLLLSIRFHDVGNMYGRENHEQNIAKVIRSKSIVHLHQNQLEARKVCAIGGAHGGRTREGSKDTIGRLLEDQISSDGHIHDIGFKKIAAITRIADEICENRKRTGELDLDAIPAYNLVFHKYAYSIVDNYIRDKIFYLKIKFE